MKRTIALFALLLVMVGAVGYLVVAQNQKYNQTQAQVTARHEAAVKAQQTRTATEKAVLINSFNAAVAECQKGKKAHDALTPTQKRNLQAPVCPVLQGQ